MDEFLRHVERRFGREPWFVWQAIESGAPVPEEVTGAVSLGVRLRYRSQSVGDVTRVNERWRVS